MQRRTVLLGAALAAVATPSFASGQAPFTQAAFAAAQAAGKPILVAVHASWCPICAKQKPAIANLVQQPAFKDLVTLVVDFDAQKDVCQSFGVTKQSTLIALRGKVERGRSVGVTAAAAIEALMLKATA